MSNLVRTSTLMLTLVALTQVASAGGPLQSLPQDGSWVKLFCELEVSGPEGVNGKHTGTWTIRSVGTKMVRQEPCRWIEIEEHIDQGDDSTPLRRWFKCLVREKDLQPGGDLVSHRIEHWRKDSSETASIHDNDFTMLPIYFRGTPKTSETVAKPQRVFWQQGDFTVPQAAEQTQTIDASQQGHRWVIQDVVWKKDDIPFGVAALTSSISLQRDGLPTYTWVYRFSLTDHGTGGKSKISEAN